MTTLHDMLKGDGKDTRQNQPQQSQQQADDLRGRYRKIGLSAVAAGAPYGSKAADYGRQTRQQR